MAQMTITIFSQSLKRFTDFCLILPTDTPPEFAGQNPAYQRPPKTLFLLHGYSGSMHDFLFSGNAQNLAMKYNLAIVCASGENSFYLNQKGTGRAYGDYFGVELPAYLQKTFGIAKTPEETMIGGFSMGGFGALHVGLSHPEQFGSIIALSSALIIHQVATMTPGFSNPVADYDYYAQTFGDPAAVLTSRNNPEVLVRDLKAAGAAIPSIYMACGTEDFLVESNRAFAAFLNEQQVPVKYEEGPGVHNWDFWNPHMDAAIRYHLGI